MEKEMKIEGDICEIQDLYVAAFLKVKGCKLKEALRNPVRNFVYFYFEGKDQIKKLLPFYYNGDENICASDFVNAVRDLKSLIKSV